MIVTKGSTDVTTYFKLYDVSTGLPKTGYTITDLDLQYTRSGAAPAAKVDATALAATDSAHADNKAIEIDATNSPGLYRVDWPDAAFAAGVNQVILEVSGTGIYAAPKEVALTTFDLQSAAPDVNVKQISGDSTAADGLELCLDGGGGVLFADLNGKVLGGGSGVLGGVGVRADARQINGDADAAARLALSAKQIVPGTIDTAAFTPTTTEFEADDITEATADHYVGRVAIFTSGALLAQATAIRDYVLSGGRGRFTVSAMTEAPANNDTFVIV